MVKLWLKKNKNISDSKVEGGACSLGQTRALEPGNTFMGVGKPWENARKTIGKSEENGDLMTFKGIYGCLMIAKLTYKSWLPIWFMGNMVWKKVGYIGI